MLTMALIPVSPGTPEETNLLLRALWAQLRADFGKLAWLFNPWRDGQSNTVYFGWADLGLTETVHVGVTYQRKDIATNILVECEPATAERIAECVARAEGRLASRGKLFATLQCTTPFHIQIEDFQGELLCLEAETASRIALELQVLAFDNADAHAEAIERARVVLDVLSFCTNVPFFLASEDVALSVSPRLSWRCSRERPNTLDPEWLDDYPVVDERLVIAGMASAFMDAVVGDDTPGTFQSLLDGAHHFHCGLVAEQRRGESDFTRTMTEHAIVSYVSALEAASLVGEPAAATCQGCGQPQYRVSARVVEFAAKHLGGAPSSIVKMFYSSRSAYLHRGSLLSTRAPSARVHPQLDSSSPTGAIGPVPMLATHNLREFTSYCLRRLMSEFVTPVA
jgi:hypothetical protein